jgi:tetratricopeptide (TPR) repeat protein
VRRTGIAVWLVGLLALVGTEPATAQPITLDRVDSLLTAGAYTDARGLLERWWTVQDESDNQRADRARGLMLRARLALDPEDAEPDYLALVLGYPTSEYAPEALLRLGQGLLATGDYGRAVGYLQRLVSDYPGRPERAPGLLWLARAANAARRPAIACRAAREGLESVQDPELTSMLRIEAAASCAIGGTAPGSSPAPLSAIMDPWTRHHQTRPSF